jgi:uncharacterized membrane protein YoaK (UPF0700 family)
MKARKRHYITRSHRTARALVGHRRSEARDLALATVLAAIAGAANAGGFFAVGKYTSHMTGYISQLADNMAILDWLSAMIASLAIGAFVSGAAFSTILINWTRHERHRHQYALALALQGFFMFLFCFGGIFTTDLGRLFSLACLCFIMGMQNATITKISGARVRTTHATGMVTDIGIEIGRTIIVGLLGFPGIPPNWRKLKILLSLVFAFLGGGLVGAIGYGHFGFFFSLPLSLILLGLSLPTLLLETTPPEAEEIS